MIIPGGATNFTLTSARSGGQQNADLTDLLQALDAALDSLIVCYTLNCPGGLDYYFSKHITPKARVLFRITLNISKEIYYRARQLDDLHRLKLYSLYDSSFGSKDYYKEISR
ncbi:hypothetical protein G7Y89_g667 [Cudoniella acicularis]|uniref:Uncharacterized protein n=1 Tax=Cudoniella acicularis TaxID=354080 RepID=A0A8H4W7P5_9HELO|nr:hypothetical protein G7Y89_g667 [Cudoniella acicularis]